MLKWPVKYLHVSVSSLSVTKPMCNLPLKDNMVCCFAQIFTWILVAFWLLFSIYYKYTHFCLSIPWNNSVSHLLQSNTSHLSTVHHWVTYCPLTRFTFQTNSHRLQCLSSCLPFPRFCNQSWNQSINRNIPSLTCSISPAFRALPLPREDITSA